MKNKRLYLIVLSIPVLLSIPLIAMQFDVGVDWDLFDFLAMGTLLLITGLAFELILRNVLNIKSRIIFCGLVLLVFFLIWIELAVGIFDSPFAGS